MTCVLESLMSMCIFGECEAAAPFLGSGWEAGCVHILQASQLEEGIMIMQVGDRRCGQTSFSTARQSTSVLKLLRHDKPLLGPVLSVILTVWLPGDRVWSSQKAKSKGHPV